MISAEISMGTLFIQYKEATEENLLFLMDR